MTETPVSTSPPPGARRAAKKRRRQARGFRGRISAYLPAGRSLPDRVWHRRHSFVVGLLFVHVAGIAWYLESQGTAVEDTLTRVALIAVPALAALLPARSRRFRTMSATIGLLASSGLVIDISGGAIEAHFHVFAVVALLALYQDWLLFAIATVLVGVAHGSGLPAFAPVGGLGVDAGWPRAAVYGGAVATVAVVGIVVAKLNEDSRRRAEEYYRLLYEGQRALVSRLEEAERLKEELVAIVSHELRTPLAVIMGFGRTLLDSEDRVGPEQRRELLGRIVRNSDRLIRLVENLLEASKSREGAAGAADVAEVAASTVQQVQESAAEEGPEVRVEIQPGLVVKMGSDPLKLILSNLVSNAQKFARPGTPIWIRARLEHADPEDGTTPEDHIGIDVMNVGEPISPEARGRIFDAFVQLDSSNTRKVGGVGLGLYIVRRLVESHQGWTELECEESLVTFRVVLPAAAPSGPEEKKRWPFARRPRGLEINSPEPAPAIAES